MKKSIKIGFAAIIAASAMIYSCGKYEEGPKMSLASKKGRLANTWVFESQFKNGTDITSQAASYYTNESETYAKDGGYTYSVSGVALTGKWEFLDGKEDVKITMAGSTDPDTMHVVRLTSKELWTKDMDGSDTYITHYKGK